ncbi:hypothetical protein [Tsukamurella asaccharolytica]|uniref:hypothetical protein n=1 Tax=Tsukamurella asaccharolytica TaxID=2592067 RepID=UPI001E5D8981|nr:hypothetical protein [Tsukamurella asaccharolytica]
MRSRALLALPLIAAATLLAACGGSSDPAAQSSSYPIPTQDVVSSVAVDPAAQALLPAGTTELTLGLTRQPGVNNCRTPGRSPMATPWVSTWTCATPSPRPSA